MELWGLVVVALILIQTFFGSLMCRTLMHKAGLGSFKLFWYCQFWPIAFLQFGFKQIDQWEKEVKEEESERYHD